MTEILQQEKFQRANLIPIVAGLTLLTFIVLIFPRVLVLLFTAFALISFALIPALLKRRLEGNLPIGPEFNTFGTIIMGIAFGPIAGAGFGVTMTIIASSVERSFNFGTPISLIISSGIGFFALPAYERFGLINAGMGLLVIATVLGNAFIMSLQRDTEITFLGIVGSLFNFAVNYLIFAYVGVPLVGLLT